MTLDAVTFGEVMAMFVAAEPGPLERGRPRSPGRWPAPRPTSPPAWPGSVTAPAGSAGSATTRSADSPSPSWPRPGSTPARSASTRTRPTGFQLKSYAGGGDPEVVYFRRNSAGSRLAPSAALDAYIAGARHLHLTGIPLALSATTRDFAFRAVDVAREPRV